MSGQQRVATLTRPPASNTGANPATRSPDSTAKLAPDLHFDWYQATIRPAPDAGAVASILGPLGSRTWKRVPGQNGYAGGQLLEGLDQGSVSIFHGGTEDMGLNVKATGHASIAAAALLRRWWPDHLVSRADVALDFEAPEAFERLYRLVHTLARGGSDGGGRKIGTATAGDWLDREAGRTFYAGSISSRLRVVVYEKGHEQLSKDPGCGASTDWTRVEWRVKPDARQKRWAASATPLELLGLTPFGALVADALLVADVPVATAARRFASQDPLYWMVRQYGPHIRRELMPLDPADLYARLVQLLDQAPQTYP